MRASLVTAVLVGSLVASGCAELAGPGGGGDVTQAQGGPVATSRPGGAQALVLSRPDWRVGDEWQYSDGYALRVTQAGGRMTRFDRLDAPGRWFTRNGFFTEEAQSSVKRQVVFRSEDPERFYTAPLGTPVVFVREYLRDKQLVRHQTSWVVESRDTITVPAGTFDTLVLVMRTRSLTGNWVGYERWWYAPSIRNYVRMEYRYGEAPEGARVLTKYSLAP